MYRTMESVDSMTPLEVGECKTSDDVDTSCGYTASCKPKWLQRFANVKSYLAIFTLIATVQGFSTNGINNANITSYERRYLLTSKESSLVAVFYDISAGFFVIFVGYFGGPRHQPRIMAISIAIMSLGNFVMSLAHFASPPYKPGNGGVSLMCNLNDTSTQCEETDNSQAYLKNYLYILLFGQILNGYCGAVLFSIGITFLNRSASAKSAALYIGILSGGGAFGPALGYLLGGSFLDIYVEYPTKAPEGLTPSDPAWVGAWWVGFVGSAVLSSILASIMFLFPKELPDTAAICAAKVSEAHDNGTETLVNAPGFGVSVKDLPKSTRYLFTNPSFMFITAVSTLEFSLIMGFSTFLPKLISNQFGEPGSWASILTGLMAVPTAAVGQIISGIVIKKYDLNVKQMMTLALGSSVMAFVLIPVYLAKCPSSQMAGVNKAYPGSAHSHDITLTSNCNEGCGCSTNVFNPVCSDGVQYLSACLAGCTQEPAADGTYHQCRCPRYNYTMANFTEVVVSDGRCDVECNLLYNIFVPFAFLQFFFTFFAGTPISMVTLRVVPEKIRTYGVAVQWVFMRFLGSIPGPLIFGTMIDASCTLWHDDCGEKGSCWVYDNSGMAQRIFILGAVLKALSIIFNILALKFYKPPATDITERDQDKVTKRPSSDTMGQLNERIDVLNL